MMIFLRFLSKYSFMKMLELAYLRKPETLDSDSGKTNFRLGFNDTLFIF